MLEVVEIVAVVDVVDVVESRVLVNSAVVEGMTEETGATVAGAGGSITLKEIVAPQSARGVPFGQHPASVQ